MWSPSTADANKCLPLAERRLLLDALISGLAPSTVEVYGSGLLAFHVVCDAYNVPEPARAPVGRNVLALFVAEQIGRISESAIKNALAGVRAWHLVHRHDWSVNDAEIELLLRAAARNAPPARPKRPAFSHSSLLAVLAKLKSTVPLDAAVAAALLVAFWGTARLGELLPHTLSGPRSFSPDSLVTPANFRTTTDANGLPIAILHLPRTKVAQVEGEDIYWAPRSDASDATAALQRHFSLNAPAPQDHLFAYKDKYGRSKALTRATFLSRVKSAARAAGADLAPGHSIRVSSTTFYLLSGMPFDAVRVKGRWASDAFVLYLRRHAEIMAPYLQENTGVHTEVLARSTVLPPTRRR